MPQAQAEALRGRLVEAMGRVRWFIDRSRDYDLDQKIVRDALRALDLVEEECQRLIAEGRV